ncbi:SDR family oxidoreductase [Methylopila turkensis]|nr:SDR family oxidoreductase [Methylopila turkensis]
MRQLTATGRFGEGAGIRHAVTYLASDKARYVTGTTLTVDSGANA